MQYSPNMQKYAKVGLTDGNDITCVMARRTRAWFNSI